jgi:hypothetical protein
MSDGSPSDSAGYILDKAVNHPMAFMLYNAALMALNEGDGCSACKNLLQRATAK